MDFLEIIADGEAPQLELVGFHEQAASSFDMMEEPEVGPMA